MNNHPFHTMKHRILPILFCSALSFSSYSQDAAHDLAVTEVRLAPIIIERGAHHRVWQTATLITDAEGLVTTNTGSYTELATGMHYWEDGQWKDSVAAFELFPDGALAQASIKSSFHPIQRPSAPWFSSCPMASA